MSQQVVVIEDDRLFAAQFERLLKKAGFSVTTVDHAPGAMDIIDAQKPDLILADMLLTGSTLMPLLNELQSHPDLADIPVVLVTTIAERLRLEDLIPYGVKIVLDKTTMHPDEVVIEVKRLLV